MKPRIVILSAFATPFRSGAEACAEEVPRMLRDRFDFVIVTARMRGDLPRKDHLNGIPVIRIGVGSPIDKWLFPFLAPFTVRSLKPQIIHAVLESFAGLALVLCRFLCPRAKRMLTQQSTNTAFLLGLIYRHAGTLTAISSTLVERSRRFGRTDVHLIPNGVPYAAIRDACGRVPKVPGRILFVGRLERMKGVDTLLQALHIIQKQRSEPLDVHIVGGGSLQSLLEMQGSSFLPEGSFLGPLPSDAVHREYAEAEIFAALSRSEALGNVFLEAQAAGCAVVATTVGGIPEIVTDGVTGLLVPPDDPPAAAEAVGRLLHDAPLRERLSQAGVSHASAYDWSAVAEKYSAIYSLLLKQT